jgi:hypothetical protein
LTAGADAGPRRPDARRFAVDETPQIIRLTAYRGCTPNVNPDIANEFSAAAFRLHSLVNNDVEFFGNDGQSVPPDEVDLTDALGNPNLVRTTGIDPLLQRIIGGQFQRLRDGDRFWFERVFSGQ